MHTDSTWEAARLALADRHQARMESLNRVVVVLQNIRDEPAPAMPAAKPKAPAKSAKPTKIALTYEIVVEAVRAMPAVFRHNDIVAWLSKKSLLPFSFTKVKSLLLRCAEAGLVRIEGGVGQGRAAVYHKGD